MPHPIVRFFLCLLMAVSASAMAAEKRVALLIGNSRYSDAPLKNPGNDVKLVGDALRQLQFDVSTVLDADQKQIQRALRDFGTRASGASVAFFYYSGHGLQSNGENYLVPLKAQIDKEADIAIEGVAVNGLMRQIEEARPGAAILVLDACRDNPYAGKKGGSKGLGRIDAPTGTLVAYATTPGNTATDDGIYARHLSRYLAEPGLELKKIFDKTGLAVDQETKGKQRPRKDDGLYAELYLNGSLPPPPPPPPTQLANLDVSPGPKPPVSGGLNKQGNPPALPGDSLRFDRVKRSLGVFYLDQEIGVPDERLPEPRAHGMGLQIPHCVHSQGTKEGDIWRDSPSSWAGAA